MPLRPRARGRRRRGSGGSSAARTRCARSRCVIHPLCGRLLHSDFPHQRAEFRPSRADLGRWSRLHLAAAVAVLVLNLVAGVLGGVAWLRDRPSIPFWYLLRAAQVAVFFQVAARRPARLHRPRGGRRPALRLRGPAAAGLAARRGRAGRAPPSTRSATSTSRPSPRHRQRDDRAGDRAPRDGDHGRELPGDLLPRPARGGISTVL